MNDASATLDDAGRPPAETVELADDPEGVAMLRRLQARLFDLPRAPVRVGRFALSRVLGAGGMGVVHLAHDDVLDRRVAIKLIRSERTRSAPARARLLREAQAMARLSHANVVQVYEAGEHEGCVYVAMELVEGPTLRQWLTGEGEAQRWEQRLPLLLAAGRGLAAAHRAGVVHRDFKPENVLLTAEGEPKVGDFGLAGLDAPASTGDGDGDGGGGGPMSLTETGAIMGTPLYMAPEQLEARPVDARSDQFAFCVVAYEVLVGQRPFAGQTLTELTEEVCGGRVRPIPAGCRVPAWLRAAIGRGLCVDPDRRFPSMDALLDAMTPRRGRRGAWALAGVGVALGLGGLVWAQSARDPVAGASPCERGRTELAAAWSPARRDALGQALHATALPYAADSFARIAPALDAYARDWADGYFEACTAGEAGDPSANARLVCLEHARRELGVVTDELAAGQRDAVRHASSLVLSLPSLDRCRDAATAGFEGSLEDPALWELLDALARAQVLAGSGRLADAEAELVALRQRAGVLQRPALEGRAALELSAVAHRKGAHDEAHQLARDALAVAERTDHDELRLHAWRRLSVASRGQGQLERAAFELERAELLAERPSIVDEDRAELRYTRAVLLHRQGRTTEAVAAFDGALAAFRARSPEHPSIAGVLSDMAITLLTAGQPQRALAAAEQALARSEQRLGPRHPMLAPALGSAADQHMSAGRFEDALRLHRRALDLLALYPEEQHEGYVRLAAMVGQDLAALRRFDEAERAFAHAAQEADRRLPPGHPARVNLEIARGNLELDRRRFDAAIPHLERALALEPDLVNRSVALTNLALALAAAGDVAAALTRAEEARAANAAFDPGSPIRVGADVYLAEADRRVGR
jgi:eukaryotic-like serine/threonine-protein kinase